MGEGRKYKCVYMFPHVAAGQRACSAPFLLPKNVGATPLSIFFRRVSFVGPLGTLWLHFGRFWHHFSSMSDHFHLFFYPKPSFRYSNGTLP